MRNFVNTVKRNGSGHSECNEMEVQWMMVREAGVEPARSYPLDPKPEKGVFGTF